MKTAIILVAAAVALVSGNEGFFEVDPDTDQSGICSLGLVAQLMCISSLGTGIGNCQDVSILLKKS